MDNDFKRVSDEPIDAQGVSLNASQTADTSKQIRSSVRKSTAAKKNPYKMDFSKLTSNYFDDSTVKLPFVKSSFLHYSKCPRNMYINGHEYKDLVLTMEIVQAPADMNY